MKMLMTLSHCVVVRTFLASGVSGSDVVVIGSAAAAASAFFSWLFAMMTSASAAFFSAPLGPALFFRR